MSSFDAIWNALVKPTKTSPLATFVAPPVKDPWIAAAPFRSARLAPDSPETAHIRPVAGKSGENGSDITRDTEAALSGLARREAMR